ncbi:hypothetical protein EUGRSUZ_B00927 [Eucalyptus grandis]|uniref:Uncharacterized protein n=1 Tax=Eucalyptus grandis TaxID=71139 RepID=A0ACC3L2L9_EUCGR|nr:hypothetical protein EUGRSUZ_B00927 [Eucalyptus grandis]
MAEAIIVGIAGKIVAYLVPQALDNVGMLWGVNRELEALGDTVSTLQSVLDHAEEQYHRSPQIKVWVDKLKEAFYDAQDMLEEFNIEAMQRELSYQTLVNLWMAKGFIKQPNGPHHLEDIACGYFKDLLWSNFFQDYQENEETCKMHDLMHDLACLVAGTECWVTWDHPKHKLERTRHISHDSTSNFMGKLPISRLKASTLRTILLFTRDWRGEPTSEADLHRLIQSFKRLRILHLHAANVEKVPRSIGKLKYLTYLDLSYNKALKSLPNSITRLQNLQTLNLNYSSLEELPKGIRKLVSLRILNIDDCDKLYYMPCGLGQLSLLHRLNCFILPKYKAFTKNYCGLGELNRLNNIRGTLSIKNLDSVTNVVEESKAANLREKHSLEVLVLSWDIFNITDEAIITKRDEALLDGLRPPDNLQELIIDGYNGESFPMWMTELPNLVELKLAWCKRCKHFPQFGLSKLKRLDISGMNSLEYLLGECLESLTSLESLDIYYLPRLTSLPLGLWHLSKLVDLCITWCYELDLSKDESGNIILDFHGLQSLRSLRIGHLPKLESLPQWILQLRSLECLYISDCPNFKALSEQIEKCEELDLSKDESGNILDFHGCLQSLCSVTISHLPRLTSLPQWLLQAHNLVDLNIWYCDNLKDIPEQIEVLQSLRILNIMRCDSLTSFPEAMRRLTSLTHLNIYGCGELEESCKRRAGED